MLLVHEAKALFNRRWLRPVLGPVVSWLGRGKGNGVQKIFCDDGIWIHQTSRGYFAYREPFVRLNMEQLDAFAQSVFSWGYRPRAGDVIVDVGAGVGEEALTFSRAGGEHGHVISIEAHPETFRCLEKLVQYNRLGNVTAIQQAVSEPPSCEWATIEDGKHYLCNRLGGDRGIPVAATTLDGIHQKLGLGRIHFLKMNIEGAERFAIRGMATTLRETESLCVRCHDFLAEAGGDSLRTKRTVREFLEQSGFRVVQRLEPNLAPYARDQVWGYNEQLQEKTAS